MTTGVDMGLFVIVIGNGEREEGEGLGKERRKENVVVQGKEMSRNKPSEKGEVEVFIRFCP